MTGVRVASVLGLLALVAACSGSALPATDLGPVVDRDAIAFDLPAIPAPVVADLADHRLVVIGETHLVVEQRLLTVALVTALHERGFRQLLLEWPHMADVVLQDYVADGGGFPGWEPPGWLLGDVITAVRDLNRSLPEEERIAVRAIDVNLDEYGGASDFVSVMWTLRSRLAGPDVIVSFLGEPYGTADDQRLAIDRLAADLRDRDTELIDAWGEESYAAVTEMVEVEAESIEIRARRDDDYGGSVRRREAVMKRLVDERLCDTPWGTLLNVGGNHAQKKRLKGTSQQWLGDYLVHESGVAGDVMVVAVVPAAIEPSADGSAPAFELGDASPDNELFRLLDEAHPGRYVYLPFDDPIFASERIAMNYEGAIYTAAPKKHYDAVVLLPAAHRIPIP